MQMKPPFEYLSQWIPCVCVFCEIPSLPFSVRHIVLSNRHVCVPLEVTFSFSDWIRREWLDQQNTNIHFEKNPVWLKQAWRLNYSHIQAILNQSCYELFARFVVDYSNMTSDFWIGR